MQGFTRLETGAGGRGVWFHKYFIQAKPELIARIKRVPVKQTNEPRPTESDLSSNPTMDYTNYKLNDKVAKVIATSSATSYHMDSLLNKSKAKRPSLPMRRRSNSDDSEDSAPPRVSAATTSGHPAGILSAGMMQPQTSLQRLYAQNAATASAAQLTGSNASRLPPLILTSYQPAAAANARLLPQGYPTPGSFLTGATAPTLAAATANPPHVEDELVARQLAAMGRPAHTLSAAAAAPRPSLVTNDAAVMARAMVLESERRRQAALVQAQAAQAAQAAHAHAQAQAQAAQAQALGAAMPPTSMGSDADILAAIQQRQRFLSRLESEFKAKIGPRGA